AEANHGIAEDRLYVKATYVDGGPVMKRWRARARGRVARIKKRTCHITVTLAQAEIVEAPAKPRRAAAKPATEQPKAKSAEKPVAEPTTEEPKAEEKPKPKPKPKRVSRRKKTEEAES